jgi:6-phosphogluconolactonase
MQRTHWLLTGAFWLTGLLTGLQGARADQIARVYFGTYTGDGSRGIYTCELNLETGAATAPQLAAELTNPSFLAFDPEYRFLYAVNEVSDFPGAEPGPRGAGGVTAFRIDPATGALTKLNSQLSGGGAPCHLVVDATGRNVLVANYTGGSVSVLPINPDGSLQPVSCLMQHTGSSVDKSRQEAPHAHSVNLSADNRFAFVADLGLDQILIYRFDPEQGQLTPHQPPFATVRPGGGPRHFTFHPNGKYAYTNNEMTLVQTAFRYDAERGTLEAIQDITTLPADADRRGASTAETLAHPSGKFVYVSNRGHGTIAIFQVRDDGSLRAAGHAPSGGKVPRNFGIDPTGRWLLSANQDNGVVLVQRIDQETGALEPVGEPLQVPRGVCVRMFL